MSQVAGSSLIEGVLVDWAVQQPAGLSRLPVELLSREQTAAELQRVVAERAMLAAYEAELVLALADASPDIDDPPAGARGARSSWSTGAALPGVSEFFPAELAMVLNCGRGTAANLAVRASTWRANLPGTWTALAAGALDEPRARVLAEVLEHATPDVGRRVEAELLPEAHESSIGKLRTRAQALLATHDAAGVEERREQALELADVRVHPSPREGVSTVAAELSVEEAAACYDMVDRLARMLKADGDQRPIGQLRTVVFAALLCRPWDTSRPAVTAHLQIKATLAALAGESSEAGEVSGLAITAGHLRDLLRRLDALEVRAPAGGSVTIGITDDDGALLATATLDQLRALARRGCPDHPDHPDHPDYPIGETGGCGCPVLERPTEVHRYTPSAAQQRFVHTRDRTCRFPTCGQRVGWADADHVMPHACGGKTDCTNLCCLCRSHHRLKTFAPGWHFHMGDDGTLTVTTPSGVTRTTRPPGLRAPRGEPEPAGPPDPGPSTAANTARGRHRSTSDLIRRAPRDPRPRESYGDDPPPF